MAKSMSVSDSSNTMRLISSGDQFRRNSSADRCGSSAGVSLVEGVEVVVEHHAGRAEGVTRVEVNTWATQSNTNASRIMASRPPFPGRRSRPRFHVGVRVRHGPRRGQEPELGPRPGSHELRAPGLVPPNLHGRVLDARDLPDPL